MSTNKKLLEQLLTLLAEDLKDRLENGEEKVLGDEVVRVKPGAATLNVIRQFLKDNGIDAVATPDSPLGRLSEIMATYTPPEENDDYA